MYKCQVCGMPYIGEFIEYNTERNVEVYKCEKCNGLNMEGTRPKPRKRKNKMLEIDDLDS